MLADLARVQEGEPPKDPAGFSRRVTALLVPDRPDQLPAACGAAWLDRAEVVQRDFGEQRPYPGRLHGDVRIVQQPVQFVELRAVIGVRHGDPLVPAGKAHAPRTWPSCDGCGPAVPERHSSRDDMMQNCDEVNEFWERITGGGGEISCAGAARSRGRRGSGRDGGAGGRRARRRPSPRRPGRRGCRRRGRGGPVGAHLDLVAEPVHGAARRQDGAGRLDREARHHRLAGGDAAEDAAGPVGGEGDRAVLPSASRRHSPRR